MSRSKYVYTVQNGNGLVLGAFTVKHELKRAVDGLLAVSQDIGVTRVRDGYLGEGAHSVVLNPWTLEADT